MSSVCVRCVIDISWLVEAAALLGSYEDVFLNSGLIFGSDDGADRCCFHFRSVLAWPVNDELRMRRQHIAERIEHQCLAREEFRCLGVFEVTSETRDLSKRTALLEAHPSFEVYAVLDPELFSLKKVTNAVAKNPEAISTLHLISSIDGTSDRAFRSLIKVYDKKGQCLDWELKSDYSSFMLYESLYDTSQLSRSIATTTATSVDPLGDPRSGYREYELRMLGTIAAKRQKGYSKLFLSNSLEEVDRLLTRNCGDLTSNPEIDPIVLRQIQFCSAEITKLNEKKKSAEARTLMNVLEKLSQLASLTAQNAEQLAQLALQKKHKQPRKGYGLI
eukprot:Gregarina_sp_Poly_1__8223@NODE_478_length_8064_cov_159_533200_g387_i0_p4_GENE_NODE_478_length_8064_cov_159_533200_g387_i0NODE_478_length_8064_cov_159_533200_g387_i0_p4_ORF_typecomplete_len332_score43_44_NODE_478_length_8064_cov_159_533200_g387_i032594254